MTDSRTLPDLVNKPGKTNWVERSGGLPSFIKRIAKHLVSERGYNESRAIATAVSQCKKVCATGRTFGGQQSVSPAARQRYCKAAAEWEAKRAKNAAKGAAKDLAEDDIASLAFSAEVRIALFESRLRESDDGGALTEDINEALANERALVEAATGRQPWTTL